MSQDSSSNDDPLSAAWSFGKLMPGFGLFEQWAKGAGAAMPSMGQWVAPTLDPAELDKRIQDLRTVQFWLEQNARMIAMTVQALEVQRMTLDTLKSMNVPAEVLRDSLKARMPEPAAGEPAAGATAPPASSSAPPESAPEAPAGATPEAAAGGGAIDPMRWWGSLTKQFTDLAANTLQDALQTEGAAAQAKRRRATGAKSAGKATRKAGGKAAGKATSKPASGKATGKTAPAARRQSARRGSASAED